MEEAAIDKVIQRMDRSGPGYNDNSGTVQRAQRRARRILLWDSRRGPYVKAEHGSFPDTHAIFKGMST